MIALLFTVALAASSAHGAVSQAEAVLLSSDACSSCRCSTDMVPFLVDCSGGSREEVELGGIVREGGELGTVAFDLVRRNKNYIVHIIRSASNSEIMRILFPSPQDYSHNKIETVRAFPALNVQSVSFQGNAINQVRIFDGKSVFCVSV